MPITTADIVKPMSNEPNNSTLGWDIVVNYSDDELNNLLRQSYHNDPSGHLKTLSIDVTGYDEDDNPYKLTFNLDLGPPLIQFFGGGTRPSCTLTIPVDGGESKTSTSSAPIAAGGYAIELSNLEMATVSGFTDSNGTLTPSTQPFVFPPQGDGKAAVTIDLRTSKSLVVKLITVDEANLTKRVEAHRGDLENGIGTYFNDPNNATSIQYQLASVDGSSPPSDYIVLQPKSFRFAVYQSEQFPTTILSIFIHASDQTNGGLQVDLQTSWQSQWIGKNSYGVPPIPDSHTASIIFNSTMMHQSIILPTLKNSGANADSPVFQAGTGLLYHISTHQVVQRDKWKEGASWTSAFKVNLDDSDKLLALTLGQHGDSNAHATGSIAWQFSYSFDYGTTTTIIIPNVGPEDQEDDGTAEVHNALKKTSAFSDTLADDRLQMNLEINVSDWDLPSMKKTKGDLFFKIFGGDVPHWVASELPSMPSFELNMGSLYFLLTTNLLMPGEKVISIDTSSEGGLRIPHDYYLVGNIVDASSKVEASLSRQAHHHRK